MKRIQVLKEPLKAEGSIKMLKAMMNIKGKSSKNFLNYINHQKLNKILWNNHNKLRVSSKVNEKSK